MQKQHVDVFGRQAEDIRTMFGDLRIVEAKADAWLYVSASEHERGKRGDPNRCKFSRACKRAWGASGVLFYPTVAYIDLPDPYHRGKGPPERVVVRFVLPARTRRDLKAFDMGDDDEYWEAVFVLKAPSPGVTLAAKAEKHRARKRRLAAVERGEVELEPGEAEQNQRYATRAKKSRETRLENNLLGIRSGFGRVKTTS